MAFIVYKAPDSLTYTIKPAEEPAPDGWIVEVETWDAEYLTHPEYIPEGAVVV